ncbi:uncharacterized protein LOC122342174 [Puntigrus tetrazona]|uniref:uncharacterized protein LOC122342174 n=1 Tax=Puntigrus tetrazona TaxID=1606681 RepID=UPI001C8A86EA|nr:uncharacterized protein LOC122342174 [Puntigrus tetrazona]
MTYTHRKPRLETRRAPNHKRESLPVGVRGPKPVWSPARSSQLSAAVHGPRERSSEGDLHQSQYLPGEEDRRVVVMLMVVIQGVLLILPLAEALERRGGVLGHLDALLVLGQDRDFDHRQADGVLDAGVAVELGRDGRERQQMMEQIFNSVCLMGSMTSQSTSETGQRRDITQGALAQNKGIVHTSEGSFCCQPYDVIFIIIIIIILSGSDNTGIIQRPAGCLFFCGTQNLFIIYADMRC